MGNKTLTLLLFLGVFILGILGNPQTTFAACAQDAEAFLNQCVADRKYAAGEQCGQRLNVSSAEVFRGCVFTTTLEWCRPLYTQRLNQCNAAPPPPPPAAPQPAAPPPDPTPECERPGDCWDGNECTKDVCDKGVCGNPVKPEGTVCSSSPALTCTASGSCSQPQYTPSIPEPEAPEPEVPQTPVQPVPRQVPSVPRPAPRPAPVIPVITCSSDGISYSPGQKRYDCFSPRDRGSCESDAGYGIPFVCSERGNWDVSNEGMAECSSSCAADSPSDVPTGGPAVTPLVESPEDFSPVPTEAQACPVSGDTCIYEGEGGLCYSGTGGYGLNPPSENGQPGCNYSCGPVECPVISEPEPAEEAPYEEEISEDYCFGEVFYACGNEGNMLMTNWFATEKYGPGSCNIFIRDASGDHTISNECNAVWSGTEIPGGNQVENNGTYELYVSNGSETCFNQLAAQTQLSCEVPSEEITDNNEEPQPDNYEEEPVYQWLPWISDWF